VELAALACIAHHFHDKKVRYLIAGGMAVVADGYGRMTFDIDIVLKLDPDNIIRGFSALKEAGYPPRVPVRPEQFADRAVREHMDNAQGRMVVFNMWSNTFRDTPGDLFVTEPFDFNRPNAKRCGRP